MNKDNSMTNLYQYKDIKKYITKYHNPHFEETQMTVPCRVGVRPFRYR
jgi:hypothetical protein